MFYYKVEKDGKEVYINIANKNRVFNDDMTCEATEDYWDAIHSGYPHEKAVEEALEWVCETFGINRNELIETK